MLERECSLFFVCLYFSPLNTRNISIVVHKHKDMPQYNKKHTSILPRTCQTLFSYDFFFVHVCRKSRIAIEMQTLQVKCTMIVSLSS